MPFKIEASAFAPDAEIPTRYTARRPAGTEGWNEERLAKLVTRDAMIGVSVPPQP